MRVVRRRRVRREARGRRMRRVEGDVLVVERLRLRPALAAASCREGESSSSSSEAASSVDGDEGP